MNQNIYLDSTNDQELFEIIRAELFTSVISDTLDAYGYLNQMLPPNLRPLRIGMRTCGRALTVLETDSVNQEEPFGVLFHALDALKPNDIYIASGASSAYAMWGELMTTAAKQRGAVGAILNGYLRDASGIAELDFPIFAWGSYAADQKMRGRALAYNVPILIGGVTVSPGDILFADEDGVVVVPQAIERQVIQDALSKARAEKTLRTDLEAGMSAVDAFKKHGIF
ncbi:MAG TPA: RraA family protein [Anaerolineae bacterium]|nr:RraA family protein [Anaerolineae bacterium]